MNHARVTRHAAEEDDQQSTERLEGVFSRHQDELLGMLYYLLGNIEDARDALQETFIKCWRNRQGVAEIRNLRAWVFRIAVNAGRDLRSTAWRRRRKPLDNGEATVVAHDHGPEADATRREQLALIRQALLGLRPEEQEVFLLRQNGAMTYDQIAQSINIPIGTVKTRMRLALTKLRAALEAK
jgi:RNA polymerase sigma factor (sigma-70 family)